jgi:HEAT repeat protein
MGILDLFKPSVKKLQAKKDVEGLIKVLTNGKRSEADILMQCEAVKALAEIGDQRAVKPLIHALADGDKRIRVNAAEALGRIGDPRAIDPLVQCLREWYNQESYLWKAAADSLGKIGDVAVEPLIHALRNWTDKRPCQSNAKEALKRIGKPAVESLIQALKDEDYYVRILAAEALGEIEDARAVEPLLCSLKDEHSGVGGTAANALGRIGDKRALESLFQALIDEVSADRRSRGNGSWGGSFATALAKMGDKRSVEVIIDCIFDRLGSCRRDLDDLSTRLFEDYTDLIVKARFVEKSEETWYHGGKLSYNFDECNQSIERLCGIHTRISTNILHKVAGQQDEEVTWAYDWDQAWYGTLSFEHQREVAREELERRGNPPYDPSAYLDEGAWKLPSKAATSSALHGTSG